MAKLESSDELDDILDEGDDGENTESEEETSDDEKSDDEEGEKTEDDESSDDTSSDDEDEKDDKDDEDEPGLDAIETGEENVDLSTINKNFPGVLKKHPEIREAIDRDLQYRELFPKLGDASDALRRSNSLQDLNKEIFQEGSVEKLFSIIHREDKDSLSRIARNIPNELFKLDKEVYFSLAQPVVNEAIAAFAERLQRNPDKNIQKIGQNFTAAMAKFINGDKIPDPAEDKLKDIENRDRKYQVSKVREADKYVGSKVTAAIEKNLNAKLGKLNEFTQESVKNEVLNRVGEVLSQDSVFQSKRGSLWVSAKEAGFSDTSLNTIVKAMLGQVKGILPRIRAEVLEKAEVKLTPVRKKRKVVGSASRGGPGKTRGTSIDYDKMSDEDILAM